MQRAVRNNSGHQDTRRCEFVGARSDGKIASPGITEKKKKRKSEGRGELSSNEEKRGITRGKKGRREGKQAQVVPSTAGPRLAGPQPVSLDDHRQDQLISRPPRLDRHTVFLLIVYTGDTV